MEELIYDSSLSYHGTLNILLHKSKLWKGPFVFEDIFTSIKLFYTFVTPFSKGSETGNVLQFRFRREYTTEENMWGNVEPYKRLIGLIGFVQCELFDSLESAIDEHLALIKAFKTTLGSEALIIIVHNDSKQLLKFNEKCPQVANLMQDLKKITLKCPTNMEILVQPGSGFVSQSSCFESVTSMNRGDEGPQLVYRFSSLLDSVLRCALLRAGDAVRWQSRLEIERMLPEGVNKRNKVSRIDSTILPLRKTPLCLPGRKSPDLDITEISYEDADKEEIPIVLKMTLTWGSNGSAASEMRQKMVKMSKLAGDMQVQMRDYSAGIWHYRNAIRYLKPEDPDIWVAAIYMGLAAALHLKKNDPLSNNLEVNDRVLRHQHKSHNLSPLLNINVNLRGLDLATANSKLKFPKRANDCIIKAINSLSNFKHASVVPRLVIETLYKCVDFLIKTQDRKRAIKLIDSLQHEMIPQGNSFIFERFSVLSTFYHRLGLHRKSGLLAFMLENYLLNLINIQNYRSSSLIRQSQHSVDTIQKTGKQCLFLRTLLGYQLMETSLHVRRTDCGHAGALFQCPLICSLSRVEAEEAFMGFNTELANRNTKRMSAVRVGPVGWSTLQKEVIVFSIERIRAVIDNEGKTLIEASWEHCIMLLRFIFSLLENWQADISAMYMGTCIELLRALSITAPADQPALSLPKSLGLSSTPSSQFTTSTSCSPLPTPVPLPLSQIIEIPANRIPLIQNVEIRNLPRYLLPSRLSQEAILSQVTIKSPQENRDIYSGRKSFFEKPTFIVNPYQFNTSESVDWVCNDLSFIDLTFSNPFNIELILKEITFELIRKSVPVSPDSRVSTISQFSLRGSLQRISLKSVQIIPGSEPAKDSISMQPFSGCLLARVALTLANGVSADRYVEHVVLPPLVKSIRFIFGVVAPPRLAVEGSDSWSLNSVNYRVENFGNFQIHVPLSVSGDAEEDEESSTLTSKLPSSLSSSNSPSMWKVNSQMAERRELVSGVRKKTIPLLRMCPPLPRLCLLVGPCSHRKPTEPSVVAKSQYKPKAIINNFDERQEGSLLSFSSNVLLTNSTGDEETRNSVCDIIIDLHPFETRWLPIQLFAVENQAPAGETERPSSMPAKINGNNCQAGLLNILHFSLQTTSSTKKFLHSRGLLMGQFLQILGLETIKKRLPAPMISSSTTSHCNANDCEKSGYCGLLWLKADSQAFWDSWLASPSSVQCPGLQSLTTQLFIEFAANVSRSLSTGNIDSTSVIGRCVKVAIQLRLLPSSWAPIRMTLPTLFSNTNEARKGSDITFSMNLPKDACFFQFQLETYIPESQKDAILPPSTHCRFYRIEVDMEIYWLGVNLMPNKPLTVASSWQPFVSSSPSYLDQSTRITSISASNAHEHILDELVAGLRKSHTPEVLPPNSGMVILLRKLSDASLRSGLDVVTVASRPTDELLLPIPLPHSLGRILEQSLDMRWTARLVMSVSTGSSVAHYSLPNHRFGRIVPLSVPSNDLASYTTGPQPPRNLLWYFPLLNNPQFVAKLVWSEKIWLQLIQKSKMPTYLAHDCPDCLKIATNEGLPQPPCLSPVAPVEASAIHVRIQPLDVVPLELIGGIEPDDLINQLYARLAKQFSIFSDSNNNGITNLSEEPQRPGLENEEGMILYRLWMGLSVYPVDDRVVKTTSENCLNEGAHYFVNGSLRGQNGLFVGCPSDDPNNVCSPYQASHQSLLGSIVFIRSGNYFVRGLIGLMHLPSLGNDKNISSVNCPSTNNCSPVKFTSQSFIFHVRPP